MRGGLIALIALALAVPAQAQLPGMGEFNGLLNKAKALGKVGDSFRKIGEQEEVQLGGDLAGMILGAAPLVEDQAEQDHVNRLGRWLALHSERPDLPWKFGVIDNGDFNAFSMPGGYVLVTRGLIERMRSEAELAGVLAHEIAHVTRRHHITALQRPLREQALGDMNSYFHPVNTGVIPGQFRSALMKAGKEMYTKGLSEEDEYEADRMGVVIAGRSGFSPFGLAGVLQTLSAGTGDRAYALDAKTHPEPVRRLEQLDAAMGTRLDALPGVIEDSASFVTLRNPPPPPVKAGGKAKPKAKGKKG